MTFNFESWLEEAQNGLETLKAKRGTLATEQETIRIALEDTDKEIATLAAMLDAYIGVAPPAQTEEPREAAKKVTGIKKAGHAIAEELVCGEERKEDQLVTMILSRVPDASDASARKAIQALAREGVLIPIGQRGAWSYSTAIGIIKGAQEEAPQEPSGAPQAEAASEPTESENISKPATEPGQQGSLIPHEVIVVGTADVIVALEKEMKKRKSFAMDEKNIGWIATDLHCDPKLVRDALKIMVEGNYELAYEGERKVLRHRATPGSVEELKRTHIKDQPLFPDADRPPHA
jgi:hypothetical protein